MGNISKRSESLVFVGASNIILIVLDILKRDPSQIPKYNKLYIIDDNEELHGKRIFDIEVIGDFRNVKQLKKDYKLTHSLITISENHMRARSDYYLKCRNLGFYFPSIIHPNSVISNTAMLGEGLVICAGVIVNPQSSVENNVVIFTGSTIDHNNKIEQASIIGPGVHIGGHVNIGERVFIGVGAAILPRVQISQDVIVGAGAVVTKNVSTNSVVAGVPAKILRQLSARDNNRRYS